MVAATLALSVPSIELAMVDRANGWVEPPLYWCDDCSLVFAGADLTYCHGSELYLCPGCES